MDHTVQNWPRSDLNGLVRVWPKASSLEASQCAGIIGPGFWQDATNLLPVSHFQTWLHSSTDVPDHTVQNQPRSDLILAGCIRSLPNWSGPEASGCVRIIRPASGQPFWADDPDDVTQILHVYWGAILGHQYHHLNKTADTIPSPGACLQNVQFSEFHWKFWRPHTWLLCKCTPATLTMKGLILTL